MHWHQRGVPQSFEKARVWYERSAVQGYVDAQYALGLLYTTGPGGREVDYASGFRWFKMAALQGDARAQTNVGLAYYDGNGVKQDYEEAAHW